MSAIAGIVQREPGPDRSGLVRSMCDLMVHRGPHGIEILPDGPACLGQCTLSCGPSASETRPCGPARSGAGGLSVVWDGEIFNRRELGRLLGLGGDAPEAEILGACYRKWGADCARHLDGQFALAIWDARRRALYLARDRLGEKPLYYHLSPAGELVFASEIKAILRDARVPREIDHQAVYYYLFEKAFRLDETPLRSVRALPAGHSLSYRDGRLDVSQYWDIPLVVDKIADEDRALSTARDLFLEAVGERLETARRPAVLLSGGIDSCLLVGVAAARARGRCMTVTLVPGAHRQQIDLARSVARRFDTEHVEIGLDAAELRDSFDDFVWSLSKPTPGSICNYFCCRAVAKRGADTAMTGHMADTIFMADWHIAFAHRLDALFSPLARLPEQWRVSVYDRLERALRGSLAETAGLRRHLVKLYLYFRRKRGLSFAYGSGLYPEEILCMFEPEFVEPAWGSPADLIRELYHMSGGRNLDDRRIYAVLKTSIGEGALVNYEAVGGAFGLRVHEPFLDQQLIEFSRAIPQALRSKGRGGKYINRRLCEELAAPEYAGQKKDILSLPFARWLREDLDPLVADTLSPDSLRQRGYLRPEAIGRLVERFRGGDPALGWADLLAFVVLEIWLRLHVDPPAERLQRPTATSPVPEADGGPVA